MSGWLLISWRRLKQRLARFRDAEQGVAALEFSMIAPIVVLVLLGTTTYFLIGREGYRSQRATYVAADVVARQTSVSNTSLALVRSMSEHIATSDARRIDFRVSSATNDGTKMLVDWSYGDAPYAKQTPLDPVALKIPAIATGESVVIVETSVPYQPTFQVIGAVAGKHVNRSFARPRTVSKVAKTD